MPTYTVTNTRGDVVASIGVATTTADDYPIELIGQGISLYGPIVASTQYRLMEHFADDEFLTDSMPTTTIPEGVIQYRYDQKIPYIFDGSNWIRIATGLSSASVLFTMDATAENIDFTSAGDTVLFTPAVPGFKYFPTSILLIPQTVSGATDPALFSVGKTGANYEDMLESTPILFDDDIEDPKRFLHYPLSGKLSSVEVGEALPINLRVSTAANGSLTFDALLFGFITG